MRVVICVAILLMDVRGIGSAEPVGGLHSAHDADAGRVDSGTPGERASDVLWSVDYGSSLDADPAAATWSSKYPTVKFEFRNAAIGGYDSSVLIRTADHDLYPWYPDLLFFHVYGPMDKYEEIVRRVRERTTAEVVIWTSHLNVVSPDKPTEIDTSHDERAARDPRRGSQVPLHADRSA